MEEGGDDAAEVEMEIDGVPVPTPRSGGGIPEYFRPAPQTASARLSPRPTSAAHFVLLFELSLLYRIPPTFFLFPKKVNIKFAKFRI